MALLKNKIALFILLFSIVACKSNADYAIIQMDGAEYLFPSQEYDDSLVASRLYVLHDSLEVYQLPYSSGNPVLCIKKIGKMDVHYWGKYGKEEGCIMESIVSRNGNLILLNDFVKKQIWVLSFSDNGLEYDSGPIDSDINSQCIIPISRQKCIYLNPHSFKTGKQRILTSKEGFQPAHCLKSRFNCINVLHGFIATNGNGKYAYVDHITSHIELIDESGHQYKIIEKADIEQQDYYVDSNEIVFKGYVCRSFVDVCSNNDCLIALYRPGVLTADTIDNVDESELFVFDWDGNQISHYVVNAKVVDISLSKDGRVLYCWESTLGVNRLTRYEL